jgi:predicted  nucleic acid-binding Zn-ribbon protein
LILVNDSYKLFENIPNKESNIQTNSNQLLAKQKELGENNSMSEIKDELANFSKKKGKITEDIQEFEEKIKNESAGSFDELLKKNSKVMITRPRSK